MSWCTSWPWDGCTGTITTRFPKGEAPCKGLLGPRRPESPGDSGLNGNDPKEGFDPLGLKGNVDDPELEGSKGKPLPLLLNPIRSLAGPFPVGKLPGPALKPGIPPTVPVPVGKPPEFPPNALSPFRGLFPVGKPPVPPPKDSGLLTGLLPAGKLPKLFAPSEEPENGLI